MAGECVVAPGRRGLRHPHDRKHANIRLRRAKDHLGRSIRGPEREMVRAQWPGERRPRFIGIGRGNRVMQLQVGNGERSAEIQRHPDLDHRQGYVPLDRERIR